MSAVVRAFSAARQPARPWQNHELAEFYRVIDILGRAGIAVVPDMGVSDEGEPWFAFCRADTGDVVVHCARINGLFVANSVAFNETFRGRELRDVINSILKSAHFTSATTIADKRLYLHPFAVLTAFIAAALLFSKEASAHDHGAAPRGHGHGHGEAAFDKVFAAIKAAITDGLAGNAAAPGNPVGTDPFDLSGPVSLAALLSATLVSTPTSASGDLVLTSDATTALNQYDGYSSVFDSSPLVVLDGAVPHSSVPAPDQPSSIPWTLPTNVSGLDAALSDTKVGSPNSLESPALSITHQSLLASGDESSAPHLNSAQALPVHMAAAVLAVELAGGTDAVVTPSGHSFELSEISPIALAVLLGITEPDQPDLSTNESGHHAHGSGSNTMVVTTNAPSTPVDPPSTPPSDPSPPPGTDAAPTSDPPASPTPSTPNQPAETVIPSPTPTAPPTSDQTSVEPASPTTIVMGSYPILGLEQLVDYALGAHAISGNFAPSVTLESAITNFSTDGEAPLLMVFDSSSVKLPVFEFFPGVLMVDDQQLGITPSVAPAGNLVTVDLASGGTMTLLGVVTASHLTL